MSKDNKILFVYGIIFVILLVAFFLNNIFGTDSSSKKEKEKQIKIALFDITNDVTDVNMYYVKSVNQEEMARLYFNDYKNMLVNYPDEAYNLVINNDEISKEDFLEYRDRIINDYYNYNYASFSYYQELTTNCYVYRITNSKGEIFTFKTYAVMNYEVNITL